MCGRYALHGPISRRRHEHVWLAALETFEPRYNVAPSDTMPIVRLADGVPKVVAARWGLVPFWARDVKIGFKTINARAETVATKPAFREAYRRRRCLVPASGYYEWQAGASGKQPYYFTRSQGAPLAFAGLWEEWRSPTGDRLTSYTIVVCAPNPVTAAVHDRMPVILGDHDWERWLGGSHVDDLLKPLPAEDLQCWPVSTRVNTARNDDPSLILPLDQATLPVCAAGAAPEPGLLPLRPLPCAEPPDGTHPPGGSSNAM